MSRVRSGTSAALLLPVLLAGCAIVQTSVRNPIPGLDTVAIAPFFNLTQDRAVDGREFARAYFTELQKVPGFEVIPVGVTERAILENNLEMSGPEDAVKLAKLLGVDIVVVGAVTEFDPYNPRVGLKVAWYSPQQWMFRANDPESKAGNSFKPRAINGLVRAQSPGSATGSVTGFGAFEEGHWETLDGEVVHEFLPPVAAPPTVIVPDDEWNIADGSPFKTKIVGSLLETRAGTGGPTAPTAGAPTATAAAAAVSESDGPLIQVNERSRFPLPVVIDHRAVPVDFRANSIARTDSPSSATVSSRVELPAPDAEPPSTRGAIIAAAAEEASQPVALPPSIALPSSIPLPLPDPNAVPIPVPDDRDVAPDLDQSPLSNSAGPTPLQPGAGLEVEELPAPDEFTAESDATAPVPATESPFRRLMPHFSLDPFSRLRERLPLRRSLSSDPDPPTQTVPHFRVAQKPADATPKAANSSGTPNDVPRTASQAPYSEMPPHSGFEPDPLMPSPEMPLKLPGPDLLYGTTPPGADFDQQSTGRSTSPAMSPVRPDQTGDRAALDYGDELVLGPEEFDPAEPVMAYVRLFDSTDAALVARLSDYLELSGETSSGDLEAYMKRSDFFRKFTAHVMISEMLMLHGGEARRRLVLKPRRYR